MWPIKMGGTKNSDNWSVILNPLQDEMRKRAAAQQLQLFFSVGPDEAKELLENTPIILLDVLSEENAQKIKDIFINSGLDVLITSETMVKRKCFRTVWPKEPTVDQIVRSQMMRGAFVPKQSKDSIERDSVSSVQKQPLAPSKVSKSPSPVPSSTSKNEKPRSEKTSPEPVQAAKSPSGPEKQQPLNNQDISALRKSVKDLEEKLKKIEVEKGRIQELLMDSQKENEELREFKKDTEKLKKENTEYRSQREQFEGAKIEYETWVRELQEQKSKLEYRIRNLTNEANEKDNKIQDLRAKFERNKEEVERLKQELTKEMQSVKHYSEVSKRKQADLEKYRREKEVESEKALENWKPKPRSSGIKSSRFKD